MERRGRNEQRDVQLAAAAPGGAYPAGARQGPGANEQPGDAGRTPDAGQQQPVPYPLIRRRPGGATAADDPGRSGATGVVCCRDRVEASGGGRPCCTGPPASSFRVRSAVGLLRGVLALTLLRGTREAPSGGARGSERG